MNWLKTVGWVLTLALNVIGKVDRFKKEVPEALERIEAARAQIFASLEGGLTVTEVEHIRAQLQQTWKEIDDVLGLVGEVIPGLKRVRP
ncbi:hypothetical protein LCGC14_3002270 [marine sediment metagenome]|uniref:Uncharacterized protein n=1 Tax=marine sediment metagenome TaxID=412755 RepID=A0A0F8X0K7_9ZZZZ